MVDGKSKSLVAYHEVGHAVCGTLTPGHDAVQKVRFISGVASTSVQRRITHQLMSVLHLLHSCCAEAIPKVQCQ